VPLCAACGDDGEQSKVDHGDHDGWNALARDARLRQATLAFAAGNAPLEAFPTSVSLPPPAVFPNGWIMLAAGIVLAAIAGSPAFAMRVRRRT